MRTACLIKKFLKYIIMNMEEMMENAREVYQALNEDPSKCTVILRDEDWYEALRDAHSYFRGRNVPDKDYTLELVDGKFYLKRGDEMFPGDDDNNEFGERMKALTTGNDWVERLIGSDEDLEKVIEDLKIYEELLWGNDAMCVNYGILRLEEYIRTGVISS